MMRAIFLLLALTPNAGATCNGMDATTQCGQVSMKFIDLSTVTTRFNDVATATTTIAQNSGTDFGPSTGTLSVSTASIYSQVNSTASALTLAVRSVGLSTQTIAVNVGVSTQAIAVNVGVSTAALGVNLAATSASTQSIAVAVGASTQTLSVNVAASTTAHTTQLTAVGASTQTLSVNVAASTTAHTTQLVTVGASTQTIAVDVGASTASLRTNLTATSASTQSISVAVGAATATLLTDLYNVGAATMTIAASTTTLFSVRASSGTNGDINALTLPTTFYANGFTAMTISSNVVTFSSGVALNFPVNVGQSTAVIGYWDLNVATRTMSPGEIAISTNIGGGFYYSNIAATSTIVGVLMTTATANGWGFIGVMGFSRVMNGNAICPRNQLVQTGIAIPGRTGVQCTATPAAGTILGRMHDQCAANATCWMFIRL